MTGWAIWRGRTRATVAVALVAWAVLIGCLSTMLAGSQSSGRRSLVERTHARVVFGAEFATLYVRDLLSRERTQADAFLRERRVSAGLFAQVARAMGLNSAVLVDRRGRVLQVLPRDPYLIGFPLSRRYSDLEAAATGEPAVSNVAPSAVSAQPVVSFASPFQTASGLRVFAGAWDVSRTPLGAYLSHMTATPGRRVYLVDSNGQVIASTAATAGKVAFADADARLAAASAHRKEGEFASAGGERYFVSATVNGTPWRIVMSVPDAQLFKTLDGSARWLAWVAVAGLASAGFGLILMIARLQRRRLQMRRLNAELVRLAHTDTLTGVKNRRAIALALEAAVAAAERHRHDLSVLMVDVDHFKLINDTLGHQGGDRVLLHTSDTLARGIRTEDLIGRWGGEEFLVVLPFTAQAGACELAERIRTEVAEAELVQGGHPVTITIGVAQWDGESSDELIARADTALYAGKAAGRNTVQLSAERDAVPAL